MKKQFLPIAGIALVVDLMAPGALHGQQTMTSPYLGKFYAVKGTRGGPMAYIPAGEFQMGCNDVADPQCGADESPSHRVYLDAYYIDKHDVTVAEYRDCVTTGGCKQPASSGECNWGKPDRETHPINCVDWNGALTYCTWARKRLPTEAEWEKAARGTDGRVYPWGNAMPSCDYAVLQEGWKGCGIGTAWPVCSKPSGNSPYGLCDMAGNVGQWVKDWYEDGYYKTSPERNPQGPDYGYVVGVRGGSWADNPSALRSSGRNGSGPGDVLETVGFRCAVTVRTR